MRRIFCVLLSVVSINVHGHTKSGLIGFGVDAVNFVGAGSQSGTYDPGFSIMYWKGITHKIGFSVRYNGILSVIPCI